MEFKGECYIYYSNPVPIPYQSERKASFPSIRFKDNDSFSSERERESLSWRLHHLPPTTQRKKHQTFLIREQLRYQPVFQTSPKTLKTQLKVSKTLVISFAFDGQRSTSFPRTQNFLSFDIYP